MRAPFRSSLSSRGFLSTVPGTGRPAASGTTRDLPSPSGAFPPRLRINRASKRLLVRPFPTNGTSLTPQTPGDRIQEGSSIKGEWGQHNSKPDEVVPDVRIAPAANRAPDTPRIAAERAAAQHPGVVRRLSEEGWRPAKRRATLNAPMVCSLLSRQRLQSGSTRQQYADRVERGPDEWTRKALWRPLEMPEITLYAWRRKRKRNARKVQHKPRPVWLVCANEASGTMPPAAR